MIAPLNMHLLKLTERLLVDTSSKEARGLGVDSNQ